LQCSGSAVVNKSTVGCWVKRIMASETRKAECHDLPCSGCPVATVSPALLHHADPIVHEDQHITTWQLALSLLISKGCMSYIVWDLGYLKGCLRWVSWSLRVKKCEKAISSEFLAHFQSEVQTSYLRLLQQMVPGSIILNWRQKKQSMEWHPPWKKKLKKSVSAQKHHHCLLAVWRSDSWGCSAERGDG
jgi:hypothetical protein